MDPKVAALRSSASRRRRSTTVRIQFSVRVDRDGWELNFPEDVNLDDIRSALAAQATDYVKHYLASIGAEPEGVTR